jgi:hypothetical protein
MPAKPIPDKPRTEADARTLEMVALLIESGVVKSERQLAAELDLPPTVVYKVRRGLQSFPLGRLLDMAERWQVNPDYIRKGSEPKWLKNANIARKGKQRTAETNSANLVSIPFLETGAQAGSLLAAGQIGGRALAQLERKYVLMDPSLANLETAIVLAVVGESMAPTLQSGDKIVGSLVVGQQSLEPGVYIIVTAEDMLVKRLQGTQTVGKGFLELSSDNADYPPISLPWAKLLGVYKVVQLIRLSL